ncbi:OmpH family outer membrane protein [Flavobacterium sp. DG1-102-2]|uniref:OmpH family outer membrane protein n=1 Tax=Flavobacterium sp. DG1-102-2 TaxID=3081663 RepID=UPI00294930B2|nr:OmpH family outer membrane protein [Flavobacterium sp. DG1-102-2]MDV6168971.1 OmpH family outer membrane protein [Flavobacterium sp. DG1-102-2]
MKKCFFTVLFALAALTANAQGRGIKIAYLDMNYILDKVPDYAEAKSQLEQKASKWKQELEVKRNEISKLKESLQQERALLTKELIEEREEEILFQEKELLDYQEKRFGPMGDFVTQKAVLIKPIQDQVFTIAQDLAALRNYDFVFDKSSDLTIIMAAKKHDISDFIIKKMSRAAKQEKLSSKELKNFEKQEAKEELESNPDYADRQKLLDERKSARDKKIEERKAIQEEKKRAYEEKREQMKAEREAKRTGTTVPVKEDPEATATDKTAVAPKSNKDNTADTKAPAAKSAAASKTSDAAADKTEAAKAAAEERKKTVEAAKEDRDNKAAQKNSSLEERKQKIKEQREAAIKAREEKLKKNKENKENKGTETAPAETKPTTTP